jgi:hypothetical protein
MWDESVGSIAIWAVSSSPSLAHEDTEKARGALAGADACDAPPDRKQ